MYARHPCASHRDQSLDLRLRLVQSDDIVRHVQIKTKTTICTKKRGEQFAGRCHLSNEIPRNPKIVHSTPLGRFGKTEEVAKVALFLAADDSSYITGDRIICAGGRDI